MAETLGAYQLVTARRGPKGVTAIISATKPFARVHERALVTPCAEGNGVVNTKLFSGSRSIDVMNFTPSKRESSQNSRSNCSRL